MCKLDEYATVEENADGSITLALRPGVTYTTMVIREKSPGEEGYKHLSIKLRHEADQVPVDDPRQIRPTANKAVHPGDGRQHRPQ